MEYYNTGRFTRHKLNAYIIMIETLNRTLSDCREFINSLDYEDRKTFSLDYLNILKLVIEWTKERE